MKKRIDMANCDESNGIKDWENQGMISQSREAIRAKCMPFDNIQQALTLSMEQ